MLSYRSKSIPLTAGSETQRTPTLNPFTLLYVILMVAVSILNTSIGPDKRWASWLIYVEGPKVKRDILFLAINLTGMCGHQWRRW